MSKLDGSTTRHPSRGRGDTTAPHSINRLESICLGGTEQWIRIRGKDTSNPVLLLIQQGPGLPMVNEAADDNKQWHLENDFVVVYWDQRACGKSFSAAIPSQSMTVEQLITDAQLVDRPRPRSTASEHRYCPERAIASFLQTYELKISPSSHEKNGMTTQM
jgi:pimeloyl-ACP methyl ester carboxylesterase